MEATDKQKFFLKSRGIDATNLSKEVASELISNLKEAPGAKVVQSPNIEQFVPTVKPGYTAPKKSFDNSSYYVSYAKDLCVAMLNVYQIKPSEEREIYPKLMDISIAMIKKAREELQ